MQRVRNSLLGQMMTATVCPRCSGHGQVIVTPCAQCSGDWRVVTEYHVCGTAKMGPDDDPMAVVDPQLRVRGLGGLRIADASVMPRITSNNIHAPVLMIGEKCVDFLAADR